MKTYQLTVMKNNYKSSGWRVNATGVSNMDSLTM